MKKGEIRLEKLTKIYKNFTALEGIDFKILPGERWGLIGRNGSGKSTLLKIITGIATPTKGRVVAKGKINSLLEIGAGFHPDLSGGENIVLNAMLAGMTREEAINKKEEIVRMSSLSEFIDKPFYTYSSGMKLKLAFFVAISSEPDILIFDEIVSMGDEKFIQMFKNYFKSILAKKITLIFATHILEVISLYCNKTIWLEDGKVKEMGETSRVIRDYKKEEKVN